MAIFWSSPRPMARKRRDPDAPGLGLMAAMLVGIVGTIVLALAALWILLVAVLSLYSIQQ